MYRCDICRAAEGPKTARKTHAVLRPDGSIAKELVVCKDCKYELTEGVPLATLIKAYHRPAAVPSFMKPDRPVEVGRPARTL